MEAVDYVDTVILIAPDCPAEAGTEPEPRAGKPTVASATFSLIEAEPYGMLSSEVIFGVWADRHDIPEEDRPAERSRFFAKPQACLRSSDLGKRYGWAVHARSDGRIALYGAGTPEYAMLESGVDFDGRPIIVTRAMRSSRS